MWPADTYDKRIGPQASPMRHSWCQVRTALPDSLCPCGVRSAPDNTSG